MTFDNQSIDEIQEAESERYWSSPEGQTRLAEAERQEHASDPDYGPSATPLAAWPDKGCIFLQPHHEGRGLRGLEHGNPASGWGVWQGGLALSAPLYVAPNRREAQAWAEKRWSEIFGWTKHPKLKNHWIAEVR